MASPVTSPVALAAGEVSVGTGAAYGHFQNNGQLTFKGAAAKVETTGGVTLEGGRIDLNGAMYINGVSLEVLLNGS